MEFDLHSNIKIVHAIAPAALTANTNSAAVDTRGHESLEWVLYNGAAMVGGGFTCLFFESDVSTFGGEETAVPAENILGVSPVIEIGDVNKTLRVGVNAKKRYQQIRLVETGTITAGVLGVCAVLSHPSTGPVPDQST